MLKKNRTQNQKNVKIEPIDLKVILSHYYHSCSSRSDILVDELCTAVQLKLNSIIDLINNNKLWKR